MSNSLLSTIKQVDIDELIPHPRNVRRGNIAVIAESLEANGQFRPILVQKGSNIIIAGNHTVAAAKELGWPKIAVSYVEVDDDQALRILLADNRTSELGATDDEGLATLLRELDGFTGTGYDTDYVDRLFSRFEAPVPVGEGSALAGTEPDGDDDESAVGDIVRNWVGHFQLVFDDEDQRLTWNSFVRWLRSEYADAETNTERIIAFITDNTPAEEVHP